MCIQMWRAGWATVYCITSCLESEAHDLFFCFIVKNICIGIIANILLYSNIYGYLQKKDGDMWTTDYLLTLQKQQLEIQREKIDLVENMLS